MTQQDPNTLILKFTPESMKTLQSLSKNLGISVERVIAQAVGLLNAVQGRLVILKGKDQSIEIKNYVDQPEQAKFEIK